MSPGTRDLLVMSIVVVVLVALGAAAFLGLRRTADPLDGSAGGACGAVITEPTDRNRTHRAPEDLDYADAPPSFGPHLGVAAPFGRPFYTAADRPAVGNLVHSMEHGFTIAWYDETAAADDATVRELGELAEELAADGQRFLAVPWTRADGEPFRDGAHLALTRWTADPEQPEDVTGHRGNWLYCDGLDPAAVVAFVDRWSNAESPEPGVGLPEVSRTRTR